MAVIKVQTRTEAFIGTVAFCCIFSILAVGLFSCVGKMFHHDGPVMTPSASSTTEPVVRADLAPIGPQPSDPYRRAEDPTMFRQWGVSGVARINRLRILAAKRGAALSECDKVDTADLDDRRSAEAGQPVIVVDCVNETRGVYSQSELMAAQG